MVFICFGQIEVCQIIMDITESKSAAAFRNIEILQSISFLKRNENPKPSNERVKPTNATGTANSVSSFTVTDTDTATMPIAAATSVIIAHTSVIIGMIFFTNIL